MSIKKIIKIFRREGSKGGSRVEGELVNDVSGDELVEGSLESAITDSSVRKVPDQTLLTLKVRDLHLPAEPCLPASEHLDKNQPQSKFSRDVPVQQRQQQVASFRRSRVLTSLTTNQFSSLATEEDGLPAAFSPRARRMSCPSVSSPEVGRLHAPTSTLSTKNKLPIVRPRSIIRPTARALPTPSLARQRSPSLIADDSDIQAHMEQYISEPPVSDRSPPQSKVLGNSSIDEFKPRRSTGRRLSCPNVDVSHFYNPDVPAVESPILSPLIKHRDGISKTPGIPISPSSTANDTYTGDKTEASFYVAKALGIWPSTDLSN
ncbi:hypothetical protein SARC_02403 [Sphaeroforma arctica JP610]|uniref:Uncharacterized protein n=1 Tax=Sphaeroforma arctica JP610 TaxID=667725 RepID=A0A0L0G919_9EUKA|nr:hypothetical protein SARC_02403 [Sphaeroforma arctica JP610]KNC85404.1 hypothetical protein SARC_02403 [Sphaeroforma arctica JP610]|eukprot:XP_014159306.1 hypothetical protein SARC_02403 [Sphaeroforma arctica JP610]